MAGGTAVLLRPWRAADLSFLARLRNDVALQALLLATARGSTMEAVRNWAERRSFGPDMVFRIVEDAASGLAAGYVQAERVAPAPGRQEAVWRFGICLDGPFRRAGRGTAAIRLLAALLSEDKGACRLTLEVDSDNHAAIACYHKLGFRVVAGRGREVEVNGKIRNAIAMDAPLGAKGLST